MLKFSTTLTKKVAVDCRVIIDRAGGKSEGGDNTYVVGLIYPYHDGSSIHDKKSNRPQELKFGYSEKATKFEKNLDVTE